MPVIGQVLADEKAITEVIQKVFTGMEKGDSALVRTAFANSVTMATVSRDKNDIPTLSRQSSITGFLKSIGTPRAQVLHEELWNMKIQVDGDFAQAWCDYAFYIDNAFSHCGVDAFHLIKEKEGWKIFHVADTRRRDGCDVPQAIREKYSK